MCDQAGLGGAPGSPARPLDIKVLCGYVSTYELTADIRGTIRCENDELLFEGEGRPARHFRAELLGVFFEPREPCTRRIFVRNARSRNVY